MKKVDVEIGGQQAVITAEKALFFPEENILVISDLHLGKSTHFRKSGIALSLGKHQNDIDRMQNLIDDLNPEKVIFLGDLFHSYHNVEWELFAEWMKKNKGREFILVQGNHDVLPATLYQRSGIKVIEAYTFENIHLTHGPEEKSGLYNIYGHVHPGVRLYGKARQSLKLSCYYIGKEYMIMPAFGGLTGMYIIEPKPEDLVYGIADLTLIKLYTPS